MPCITFHPEDYIFLRFILEVCIAAFYSELVQPILVWNHKDSFLLFLWEYWRHELAVILLGKHTTRRRKPQAVHAEPFQIWNFCLFESPPKNLEDSKDTGLKSTISSSQIPRSTLRSQRPTQLHVYVKVMADDTFGWFPLILGDMLSQLGTNGACCILFLMLPINIQADS